MTLIVVMHRKIPHNQNLTERKLKTFSYDSSLVRFFIGAQRLVECSGLPLSETRTLSTLSGVTTVETRARRFLLILVYYRTLVHNTKRSQFDEAHP